MFAISPALGGTKTGSDPNVASLAGNPSVQSIVGLLNIVSWFILIGAIVTFVFKRRDDGPNASETAELKTYFPKSESAAHNIEDVDSELERITTDEGEKELLEAAKEEAKLGEDVNLPITEAKITSEEVEKEKKAEETRNNNEEQIMNALIKESDTINNVLNRAGEPNVDKVMHEYIKKYLKDVSSIGISLEQNQKITIKARLELLDNILDNVKKVEDILKRTKRAEHYISYIEKQVAKDMGKEVLIYMGNTIKKLKTQRSNDTIAWNQQIKEAENAKNGMADQLKIEKKRTIDQLNHNINLAEVNEAKVKETVDNFIKIYTPAVEKTISDIKKIVSEQVTFQKDLNKKVIDAFNDSKSYGLYINNLQGAIEKIGGVAYRIEKEDPNATEISELITKSQIAIEGMFLQISNINNLTIKLFSKDIKAILDDFQKLDIQSSQLGNSINGLTTSSEQVQQSYENLKKTASFEKAGQSDNISKILRAIDTMSKTSAQERQQIITQTINQINKTEADLNNELNKIIQENQRLITAQTKVMDSLKRALTTITTLKQKESVRIEQASEKVNTTTAQAAQKIMAEDAKLGNVRM
jgi:hypothetical protein